MSNPAVQAKAQALNAKLEAEARIAIDELEKKHLRKSAREAYACSVKCYDKAGATGPADVLENCVRQCQVPHQQANGLMQNVRLHTCWVSSFPPPKKSSLWIVSLNGHAVYGYRKKTASEGRRLLYISYPQPWFSIL